MGVYVQNLFINIYGIHSFEKGKLYFLGVCVRDLNVYHYQEQGDFSCKSLLPSYPFLDVLIYIYDDKFGLIPKMFKIMV